MGIRNDRKMMRMGMGAKRPRGLGKKSSKWKKPRTRRKGAQAAAGVANPKKKRIEKKKQVFMDFGGAK